MKSAGWRAGDVMTATENNADPHMSEVLGVRMETDVSMGDRMIEKDDRIKRDIFPVSAFIIAFVGFAVITTIQMKIIGNYIDYENIPNQSIIAVFGFWFSGAVAFALYIGWRVRKRYTEPLEELSDAARRVAEGDFSVYLRPRHTNDKADCMDVLVQDFDKMVEELGSIETLKTDFFSNVSHEFKTPLAVIYNNAQLLQKKAVAEEQIECVDNILDSSRRMSSLIQNMLKLNKLEKQAIVPEAEVYDVCAQLCECAVQFEDAWEKKNIEFDADMEEQAFISADPGLMELVWNNLLSNAIKYTEDGGTVKLAQKSDGDRIIVSVSDTGCGMSRDVVKHIFDKFYQGDTSHASNGNGLGLALVKRVLELSDADITVTSTPGEGSVFTVSVKCAEIL